jgi:hypothetical protein
MAQTGQLRGKVNEEQLIDLLEQVSMRSVLLRGSMLQLHSDCDLQADEAHSKANAKKGSIVVGSLRPSSIFIGIADSDDVIVSTEERFGRRRF